ncbi:MAG TPA: methylmalonyl-CoA epimerase [Acidimicrobiales bacterium]|nr:methylmalonyl-CoA epimerase [Acidimicrobiales bacterium]
MDSVPALLTDIDHVGIAVRDLDAAVAWYERTFGASVARRERIEPDGVDEALLAVGASFIQLLTPFTDESPLARHLDRRGEGIHHVGYRVADCDNALATVRQAGARLVDEHPRTGSRGTTVAFLHPTGAFGTLIELVEVPGSADPHGHPDG